MGAAVGRETDALDLFTALEQAPHGHDFYRALRRLECVFDDQPRWGKAALPANEPIRLGQEASLAFASSPLASFTRGNDRERPRLRVHLFGLLGPNGPMPLHFTEHVRERLRHHGDRTIGDFLDLIQHRFLTLFYRAWADAQAHVNRDRPKDDRFAVYVGAFIGVAAPQFRDRDGVPDLARLFHSGSLVRQVRNAEGLRAILRHFFGVAIEVREFVGHWMALGPQERTYLSQASAVLGAGAVLGASCWDCQCKFRIEIGPLTLAQYEAFLPGGHYVSALVDWVRMYACFELDWDARLILRQDEVPALTLGQSGRLGWTTWLGRRADGDAGDLCLDAEAFEASAGVRAA